MSRFKIWKTIEVGVDPKTPNEFRYHFRENDISIDSWVNDFLGKPSFTVSPEKGKINLTKVTPADLGFTIKATTEEICTQAQKLGLLLCQPEDAPRLRTKYKKQPNGGCIVVYVNLTDIDMMISYGLTRDGPELWLHGRIASLKFAWTLDAEFVFRLPVEQ